MQPHPAESSIRQGRAYNEYPFVVTSFIHSEQDLLANGGNTQKAETTNNILDEV